MPDNFAQPKNKLIFTSKEVISARILFNKIVQEDKIFISERTRKAFWGTVVSASKVGELIFQPLEYQESAAPIEIEKEFYLIENKKNYQLVDGQGWIYDKKYFEALRSVERAISDVDYNYIMDILDRAEMRIKIEALNSGKNNIVATGNIKI